MGRRHPSLIVSGLAILAAAGVGLLALIHNAGPSAPADAAGVAPSSLSCAPSRPHVSGSFTLTLSSGGVERQYILYVPASYGGSSAVPLVLNFHGRGSTAQEQMLYSEMPQKAAQAGFIAVAPQGTGNPAQWNLGTQGTDVAFVRDLLDALSSQLCIDPARIYATGMSNGAAMSARLACDLSDRMAAVGPVAGVYFPQGCPSTRPVPLIAFHGTADGLVSFTGAQQSVTAWAAHNGCNGGTEEVQVAAHVRLVRYLGCAQGATVEFYVVEGGGHTWPGAPVDLPYGPTNREIRATDLMWAFFEAHPQPEASPTPTPTSAPTATPTSAPTTAPAAPSGLTAAQAGPGSVALSWRDNASNETQFRLYRCRSTSFSCSYSQIAAPGANTTTYTDAGLSSGSYRYRLRACNAAGCSPYSNTASVSVGNSSPTPTPTPTPAATPTPTPTATPAAPSGLTAAQAGPGSVALSWRDNASNETQFRLYRCRSTFFSCSYSQIAAPGANTTTYTNAGLSSGSYRYRLRACNTAGCSAYSNTASITLN